MLLRLLKLTPAGSVLGRDRGDCCPASRVGSFAWYREVGFLNLDEVKTNGDHEVTCHLRRPQPAFIL
jgi:hypothetical protein